MGGIARRGSVQGRAGRSLTPGEQWCAVPLGGCAGRGCASREGAGAVLLTAGALPWSPRPPPAGAQRHRLSYFWNLSGQPCVRACDRSCHLRVGMDRPALHFCDPITPGLPSEAGRPLPAACLSPSPGDPGGWWGRGSREQRSLGLTSRFPKPPWAVFPAEVPRQSVLLSQRTPWWCLLRRSVL